MTWFKSAVVAAVILATAGSAHAQVVTKKALTLDGAKQVIAAAAAEAKKNRAGGVIAVVDDGGNLMALERLDGTFAAGAPRCSPSMTSPRSRVACPSSWTTRSWAPSA